ncbi:MAG: urate oxidase [Chloroflexota bacterium]|nr:urate oxidase [Chloroflexota bacterium]
MAIRLGENQYGKAEVRVVRVDRGQGASDAHEIKDLNVSIALGGDLEAVHLTGDNAHVVATDTQKNTVFAYAREYPPGEIEEFGLRLARHFVDDFAPIRRAQVNIEEYAWTRIDVAGQPHPHAFRSAGAEKRLTTVTRQNGQDWVVSGLADLVVLKSTGSEFWGYPRDRYTTLAEATDRILATAVTARWRFAHLGVDWAESFRVTRRLLVETFAEHHSLSLQQTLYRMGEVVLTERPEICEIRMSMPNKHHFVVDLAPFGLENEREVFHADDRPYGLIQGAVEREGAPDSGQAWLSWR